MLIWQKKKKNTQNLKTQESSPYQLISFLVIRVVLCSRPWEEAVAIEMIMYSIKWCYRESDISEQRIKRQNGRFYFSGPGGGA